MDFNLTSGVRRAGELVHAMTLRITVDTTLTIIDAEAATDAMALHGRVQQNRTALSEFDRLSIRPGFTAKVRGVVCRYGRLYPPDRY